eukprot:scpid41668/ scgid14188/ 
MHDCNNKTMMMESGMFTFRVVMLEQSVSHGTRPLTNLGLSTPHSSCYYKASPSLEALGLRLLWLLLGTGWQVTAVSGCLAVAPYIAHSRSACASADTLHVTGMFVGASRNATIASPAEHGDQATPLQQSLSAFIFICSTVALIIIIDHPGGQRL